MNLKIPKKISPKKFLDKRGFFQENFKKNIYKFNTVFSALSFSNKNVIRGLHLQVRKQQKILLTLVEGKIFDVCLDLRKNSKTFGKKFINILKKGDTIFIPKGFAHGFEAIKNNSLVFYQFSEYRDRKSEISISHNDPNLGIKWITNRPKLSKKDKKGINFNEFKIKFPRGV